MLTLLALIAIVLYAIATYWQVQRMRGVSKGMQTQVLIAGGLAWLIQISVTHQLFLSDAGTNLSIFNTGSLIASTVTFILIISSLRQRLDNLFIGVFPMAAVTMAAAALLPEIEDPKPYDGGVVAHILLSILAYSVLTLAAFQAVLVSQQEKALKQHHTRGLLSTLPPLQVMERLLFDMILAGFVLLTLSLITGFLFTEDLFAQHLVHKTLLSLISWAVFAILLGGRWILGWRSRTALRWTLAGFILLMLAFFGSKAVLELILGK